MKKGTWSQVNWRTINLWSMPQKIGVIIAISTLILLVGYWLIVQSTSQKLVVLKTSASLLKKELNTKQALVASLLATRQQLHETKGRFEVLLKQMPVQNEMPIVLEKISKIGAALGLSMESFVPLKERNHDFYVEQPISLSVRGTYFQLAHFFSNISEMSRLVTTQNFTIERLLSEKTKTSSTEDLLMTITATTYRFKAR